MVTGIVKKPSFETIKYDPNPKVLLIDADSIMYIANHGNEDDIEMGKFRVRELIQDIIISVQENFKITHILIFIKGEDNFRYKVDSTYKSNRIEKHPNIKLLYEFVSKEFRTVASNGGEADDYIFTAWKLANGQAVIATQDKDLKSACYGDFYNYRTKQFSYVSEQESIYNFRIQLLIGDAGDGVNKSKGFGIAKAKKVLKVGMSEIAFKKELIKVYKKYHPEEYKNVIKDVYNLLCLHHVNDLNTLNIEYGRN
jgi:hypothetical protein